MSKELPKDWRWVKLKDISESIQYGYTESSSKENVGPKFLRITDIQENNVIWNKVPYCKIDKEAQKKYLLEDGDLAFARTGATVGKSFLIKGKIPESVFASYLIRVRVGKEINEKYVANFFHSTIYWAQITDGQVGIGQPNVNGTKLGQLNIPLPPKSIQQAIVSKIEELFSEIENGTKSLLTAQQQLKTYRQSVLKWAFEGKLTESGFTGEKSELGLIGFKDKRIDKEKGSEKALNNKILKSSNLKNPNSDKRELPKGWKRIELKEVCEIKRGKSKHRPRNEPALYGGKYPFIQTGDIRNASGKYINEYSQTYSELGLRQSKLWPKGTLCITIAANIGETAILGFDACFPDSVVGLLCNQKLLLNKYTNYFFISFKQKLEELAPATAQKNINVDILEKVEIPVPSIEEQHKIVQAIESRFSVADKMEESINQSLQQAEALKQSILKKAFEGRLVGEVKLSVFKPKNEYFYQCQILAYIIKASKKNNINHGEMTLAKYTYLVDKLYGIPTLYTFQQLHLGPYPPKMKKAINNKHFFVFKNGKIDIANEDKILKYNNPYEEKIDDSIDKLSALFSKYEGKERSRKTELLATVCKAIEDAESTDIPTIREVMQKWAIQLKGEVSKNKAEKFSKEETMRCIAFIISKGWDKKLIYSD